MRFIRQCFFVLFFAILLSGLHAREDFRIVFMADVHYHDKNGASEAFDMAIDSINALNPDLILVGGDMVYDALRSTPEKAKKQAEAFLEKASKLKAPLHYAIGNHDHMALYNRKVEESHPLFGKRYYEEFFGPRYYSFDHKGWHFVVLDDMVVTDDRKYIGRVDSLQLEWLRTDLEQIPDSMPVVIMAHVPLITTLSQWYGGGTNANGNKLAIENSDEVIKLCEGKNLQLILQGHIHYYEVLQIMNRTTVISAPSFSGKWWMGKMHEVEEGFVVIDFKSNGALHPRYVDYRWDAPKKR